MDARCRRVEGSGNSSMCRGLPATSLSKNRKVGPLARLSVSKGVVDMCETG
jgi:hypothetical protein